MTLEEILQNYKAILEVRELCDTNFRVNAITGQIDGGSDISIEKEFALTFSRMIAFGKSTVHIFISLAGYLEIDKSVEIITYTIKNPRRVNFEHYLVSNENDFNIVEVKNHIDQKLENRGFNIIYVA